MNSQLNETTLYYQIYVDGKELDQARYDCIQRIQRVTSISGSDLITIEIIDPDMLFLEDTIFVEDTGIKVYLGHTKNDYWSFNGYITLIDANYPENGVPSLTIHCTDYSAYHMDRDKVQKTWENCRVSDIVREIFRKYELSSVVDDTKEVKESVSQNETDAKFLKKLAEDEIEDYYFKVKSGVGYFKKKEIVEKGALRLDYRYGNGQILSFSPRVNKVTKTIATEKDIDKKTKKKTSSTAKATDKDTSGNNTNRSNKNKKSTKKKVNAWKYNASTGEWTQDKGDE